MYAPPSRISLSTTVFFYADKEGPYHVCNRRAHSVHGIKSHLTPTEMSGSL